MRPLAFSIILSASATCIVLLGSFSYHLLDANSVLESENMQLRFSESELLREREYLYRTLEPATPVELMVCA